MIDTVFFMDRVLPALNRGFIVSLELILPAAALGFFLGLALGAVRVYASPCIIRITDAFTTVIRGVPLLVQLFFLYNCLPKIGMGLDTLLALLTQALPESFRYDGELFRNVLLLEPFGAALTGFILCSASYQSEYVRGALLSIRQGQIKAARALGFSTTKMLVSIIIPQALRRALPGCGNEIIYLIKYSSLAQIISCMELTGQAHVLAGRSYRYIEVYLAVGCYYLALTTAASALLGRLEKKFAVPGFKTCP
ncbi:amino acid ABC transporter permease [Deltaproteobacteria bacterium]|nr:amino acid ABC transporter permease [Deltaproteobacteria bacterium]